MSVAKMIMKQSSIIDYGSVENSNLLMLATDKLDFELLREFLSRGCDPNLTKDPKTGENCLHLLMYKMCYCRIPDYLNDKEET
jgi:hypothetical protein